MDKLRLHPDFEVVNVYDLPQPVDSLIFLDGYNCLVAACYSLAADGKKSGALLHIPYADSKGEDRLQIYENPRTHAQYRALASPSDQSLIFSASTNDRIELSRLRTTTYTKKESDGEKSDGDKNPLKIEHLSTSNRISEPLSTLETLDNPSNPIPSSSVPPPVCTSLTCTDEPNPLVAGGDTAGFVKVFQIDGPSLRPQTQLVHDPDTHLECTDVHFLTPSLLCSVGENGRLRLHDLRMDPSTCNKEIGSLLTSQSTEVDLARYGVHVRAGLVHVSSSPTKLFLGGYDNCLHAIDWRYLRNPDSDDCGADGRELGEEIVRSSQTHQTAGGVWQVQAAPKDDRRLLISNCYAGLSELTRSRDEGACPDGGTCSADETFCRILRPKLSDDADEDMDTLCYAAAYGKTADTIFVSPFYTQSLLHLRRRKL